MISVENNIFIILALSIAGFAGSICICCVGCYLCSEIRPRIKTLFYDE